MKKIILAILFTFIFTSIAFAGGISGGTTLDTTERQRSETQRRMDNRQCKDPGISKETLNNGKVVVEYFVPVVGATDKAIEGMAWTAKKQRKLGGVPPTGATTKQIRK